MQRLIIYTIDKIPSKSNDDTAFLNVRRDSELLIDGGRRFQVRYVVTPRMEYVIGGNVAARSRLRNMEIV